MPYKFKVGEKTYFNVFQGCHHILYQFCFCCCGDGLLLLLLCYGAVVVVMVLW